MSRYGKAKIVDNKEDFYSPILEERDIKTVVQMETVKLHNPTVAERRLIRTNTHIWKYSDRFYKLANQYYGDKTLWWIIAIANPSIIFGTLLPPTGVQLRIPVNISQILNSYNKLNNG